MLRTILGLLLLIFLIMAWNSGSAPPSSSSNQTATETDPAKQVEAAVKRAAEETRKKENDERSRRVSEASWECQKAVEHLARYDYRWTDKFFSLSSKFDRIGGSETDDFINLAGDNIEFQNGLGNWMRMHYFCHFDRKTKTVRNATAEPGRWPD